MTKHSQITCLVTLSALGIVGCGAADAQSPEDQIQVGKVDLPLSTTATNGTKYALAGHVELLGPQGLAATMSPTDPEFVDEPLFFTTVAGSYTLTLSNWSLYRVDAGMPPALSPASGAILVSPTSLPVEIIANQTAHAAYRFAVPGGVATFSNGSLNVDINVDVGYPDGTTCTQNSDCASNSCVNGVCGTVGMGGCDPMLPNSCPMGQSCVVDPATGFGACQSPSTGGLGCLKVNEVSTAGAGGPNDEFVELYNACAVSVDVTGARLVYRSATGVNDVVLSTPAPGSIVPANTFLVFGGTAFTGPSSGLLGGALAAAGGGIAIVDQGGFKYDSVGYGTATNIYVEGTAAPAAPSGSSIGRHPDGADTDDNAVDFLVGPASPGAPNL